MKDLKSLHTVLNEMRADVALSAILSIAIGVIIVLWPVQALLLLCRILAILFLIMGITIFASAFTVEKYKKIRIAIGIALVIFGIFIFISPTTIVQILSLVVGLIISLHGIKDMLLVMEGKEYEEKTWWIPSLMATITLMIGLYLIWNQFHASVLLVWFLGGVLIFDGISDLFILFKIKLAQKAARTAAEAIDVEFVEKEV